MSKYDWNEIKSSISRAAGKVAEQAEELTEKAKREVRKKAIESKLSTEYEKLGRLAYARFTSPEESESDMQEGFSDTAKQVSEVMKRISMLEAELSSYKQTDQ